MTDTLKNPETKSPVKKSEPVSPITRYSNWLRRIWYRMKDEHPATDDSNGERIDGRRAALRTDLLTSGAFVAVPGSSGAETLVEDFGRKFKGLQILSPRNVGCVDTAAGLALTGTRISAFVGGMGVSSISSSLTAAGRRLSPMLTHVWFEGNASDAGHNEWHQLDAGVMAAMAISPQDASDLAIISRKAAELSLSPAILAVDGNQTGPVINHDKDLIRDFIGNADDSIISPTPAQIDVFGRERRRLPAWFDPDHPMALCQPASHIDMGIISASRSIFFDSDIKDILTECFREARKTFNRPFGFVRRHRMDDAEMVLVAMGETAATAEKVADELRSEFGWRIGVLGIVWISPFPFSDISADLRGRKGVFVLERTSFPPNEEPPLYRRVREAVRSEKTPVVSAVSAGSRIEESAIIALCNSKIKQVLGSKKHSDLSSIQEEQYRLDLNSLSVPSISFPKRIAIEARIKSYRPNLVSSLNDNYGNSGSPEQESLESRAVKEDQPPGILKRISRTRISPDNLPRVWGDLLEPRETGEWPTFPDPLTGTGAIPALTSALLAKPCTDSIAKIDFSLCTGCGKCWTCCPESALAPAAVNLVSLLDTASKQAGIRRNSADAVRRAHRNIAKKALKLIKKDYTGILPRDILEEAWEFVADKMDIPESDRPEYDSAFQSTLNRLEKFRPIITERFYHTPGEDKPVSEFLILALNPKSCNACGICVRECPEEAIKKFSASDIDRSKEEYRWKLWEALEDTSGATCYRSSKETDFGTTASRLLSKHCSQSMTGSGKIPGSGERLSLRLAVSTAEYNLQKVYSKMDRCLEEKHSSLDELLRKRLSSTIFEADMETVSAALGKKSAGKMEGFTRTLDELGIRTLIDREALVEIADLTSSVRRYRSSIVKGADGLGRSRFSVVLTKELAERITPYPEHPFYSPLVVDTTSCGFIALGILQGITESHVRMIADLRKADILLEDPPDKPGLLDKLSKLTWHDLSREERESCPPLFYIMDEVALSENGFGFTSKLLSSDLPVKVLFLDGLQPGRHPDPLLFAISHQNAFVLSASIAYPDHLASGLDKAFSFAGPSFIHLHAPSPDVHGFESDRTLERAKEAIRSGAHMLLSYDPCAEGAYGLRIEADISAVNEPQTDIEDWAAGESRFGKAAELLPEAAKERYRIRREAILELSGKGGILRQRIEKEIRDKFELEKKSLMEEMAEKMIAEKHAAAAAANSETHRILTEQLLNLAVSKMEEN